jgi:gamma-glutamyltranspeptidase/glutathione hydrolase
VLALAGCSDSGRVGTVATANPYVSQAAIEILRQGGSAVDAAIAAQLVLSLVEPQSSGIGGGAFLMHWDEDDEVVETYDGRETAPMAAGPDLFLNADGTPMGFMDAAVGGRSVGVPGVIALAWQAHLDHGRLEWKQLFAPAIRLAQTGFSVSKRLHDLIARHNALTGSPATRDYFYIESVEVQGAREPLPVGFLRRNEAYAETLRRIADNGPAAFYEGELAQAIVDTVRRHANAGVMTVEDLAAYRAVKREPLCRPYRDYSVCGMAPPTSGGLTTLMILGILETFDLAALRPGSPMAVHLISEASKLAYADRAVYMADADFVLVPVEQLLHPSYLAERARLINPGQSMGKARPGELAAQAGRQQAADLGDGRMSTTHLAIVDRWGNAVSMTSSVEGPFGAHQMVGGFILNNQLTDFSFQPVINEREVANAVAGGKRPRSSMAPTLIFDDDGDFFAALGSPGGSRIIAYVTQSIIGLVDWNLTMQAAFDLPRHANRNGPIEIEEESALVRIVDALKALGHKVDKSTLTSGLHGIRATPDGLEGGADRRREGVVLSTLDRF